MTLRVSRLLPSVALITLLSDQLSKVVVRQRIAPQESIDIISGFIWLTHVRNEGAAFGVLPGMRIVFIVISSAVAAALIVYWLWWRPRGIVLNAAIGLVLGGAIGNLVDRASLGRVTDFIHVGSFPVFNLADSAIVVGVTILVVLLLFTSEREESDIEGAAIVTGDSAGDHLGEPPTERV